MISSMESRSQLFRTISFPPMYNKLPSAASVSRSSSALFSMVRSPPTNSRAFRPLRLVNGRFCMETSPQTRSSPDSLASPSEVSPAPPWMDSVPPMTVQCLTASAFVSVWMLYVPLQLLTDAMQPRISTSSQPKQIVGASVGADVGTCVGPGLGTAVGFGEGFGVGRGVGAKTGLAVGSPGSGVGAGVGCGVGDGVGPGVGCDVGPGLGPGDGAGDGCGVGVDVGCGVGAHGYGSQFALLAAHMKLPAAAQEAESHVVGLPDAPG